MKTLHDNDPGYVSFYKDVIKEIELFRIRVPKEISTESIAENYEFWIEEAFFYPKHNDDVLAAHTAIEVLAVLGGNDYKLTY